MMRREWGESGETGMRRTAQPGAMSWCTAHLFAARLLAARLLAVSVMAAPAVLPAQHTAHEAAAPRLVQTDAARAQPARTHQLWRALRPTRLRTTVDSAFERTAQDALEGEEGLCWRGRPLPKCRTFVLTEIGYYGVAAVTQQHYQYSYPGTNGDTVTYRYSEDAMSSQLTAEVGVMQNLGPRTALGGTFVLGFGTGGADVGIKGRYRRWLSPTGMALDLGAGIISGTLQQSSGDVRSPGVTMDVALNAADYGALVLRTDIQRANGKTARALYGGVRLGSRPAAAGSALLVAGFFALVALFSGIAD